MADYSSALTIDPQFAPAYFRRAQVHRLWGDLATGIEGWDRAAVLSPTGPQVYLERGLTSMMQGNEAEAQKDFDRCLALAPALKPYLNARIAALKRKSVP